MKFGIKLQRGSQTFDHQLELRAPIAHKAKGGRVQFILDSERREADWAEIAPRLYSILAGGRSYEVCVTSCRNNLAATSRETAYLVTVGARQYVIEIADPRRRRHAPSAAAPEGRQDILAPMPGKILKVLISENQEVAQGQGLLVIEAMKMQNELRAPRPGRVEKIYVLEGVGVETGFKLVRLA